MTLLKLLICSWTLKYSFGQNEHQDKLVKYYTGFSTGLIFMACCNFLKSSAKVTHTCKGSSTTPKICNQHGSKHGTKPKLSLIERLFLVIVCLRLGLGEGDLAQRFKVSQSTVSRTIIRNSVKLNITNFNHYLFGFLSAR